MIVIVDPIAIQSSRVFGCIRSWCDDDKVDTGVGDMYVSLWGRNLRDPGYGWSRFIEYVSGRYNAYQT